MYVHIYLVTFPSSCRVNRRRDVMETNSISTTLLSSVVGLWQILTAFVEWCFRSCCCWCCWGGGGCWTEWCGILSLYAEHRWMVLCLAESETAVVVTPSDRNYVLSCSVCFSWSGNWIPVCLSVFLSCPSVWFTPSKMPSEVKEDMANGLCTCTYGMLQFRWADNLQRIYTAKLMVI